MGGATDTKSMFVNEFGQWAYRSGAHRGEDFIIRTFLSPEKSTLEAGSGGGRLLMDLLARGFVDLHGFDFLQDFVDVARKRDTTGTIEYRVLDVRNLDYEYNSFDQLLYLQQVLCFLPDVDDQRRAIAEAFRVLRPEGTLVACLLADRSRRQSWRQRVILAYLRTLRLLTFRRLSAQASPWMRSNTKIRLSAFLDFGPYVYWFRETEAVDLFKHAGFEVIAVGTDAQVKEGRFLESIDEFKQAPFRGGLYLVCRKPTAA
jgi:SAM-dependent methyltransferase